MQPSTDERLEQAIATLNDLITLARDCGFAESAHFIAMARLQLKLELNGVTDCEFRALCDAAEGRHPKPVTRARAGQPRVRRDAEMTTTQRAYICAGGPAIRRGARRRSVAK